MVFSSPTERTNKDLAIIVVSYNTCDLLRDCLESVDREIGEIDAEVFVIDNNSSDGSADMVKSSFPFVHLTRNERNEGFAAANNIALRVATAEFVLLLNSDTVVRAGAFHELIRFMRDTPEAGYCGPRLLNADGSHQRSAYRFPTVLTGVIQMPMLGLRRRFTHTRHVTGLHDAMNAEGTFRAAWLTGACLLVRRSVVDQVGMLDEGFFFYFEETDWCRRIAKAGWEGWYVGTADVVHLGGRSVKREDEFELFWGQHPAYHVSSERHYMRRHHGLMAAVLCQCLQIVMYALIWLRNSWPFRDRVPAKARHAAAAIRYLMSRSRQAVQP